MHRFEDNLRIPGPTTLPDAVREAGARQMVNHRGPAFAAVQDRVLARLKSFFRTENEVLVLTAAGTGGLETAIVNVLSPGDRVLAVTIGAFGDRFAKIAATYGADVTKLEVEWGHAADPMALRAALAAAEPYRAVLLTHNETSTGVTNPIGELSAVVREVAPDTLLLVDAISGLGAVPFETDAWGLDIVVTGSQKSWMVPPGLTMVAVSPRAWAATETARMPRFYFDLNAHRASAAKSQTPWTPAVGIMFQLDVALELMEREGLAAIYERHAACGAAARAGIAALGFELLADPAFASNTVTSAVIPDGFDWKAFQVEIRARGLQVAGGQGALTGKIFRMGHLGAVSPSDIVAAVGVMEEALVAVGRPIVPGAGVAAAQAAALAVLASRKPVEVGA